MPLRIASSKDHTTLMMRSFSEFQVSEVYKLHRETYHLAQDYFDRFMATQRNVFKSTLQLIGITCLFIAAKVEVWRAANEKKIEL